MSSTPAAITDPKSRKQSSRWKALLLLFIVFSLGAASGIGAGGLWLKKRAQAVLANPDSTDGPAIVIFDSMEKDLSRELDLTPGEQAAMGEEFDRAAEELRSLRASTLASVRKISQQALDRIEPRLTPEKRSPFREKARETLTPWSLLPKDGAPPAAP